ncbi:hypothetical protein K3729_06295 [Rhodobacteraceae bacterium S2214]|nr:hypothetical protein K3729_06295 [Rhodobacteraceae bacterium S2214]
MLKRGCIDGVIKAKHHCIQSKTIDHVLQRRSRQIRGPQSRLHHLKTSQMNVNESLKAIPASDIDLSEMMI